MADYTALVEAGSSLVELLRDNLTPEPISNRELIALCSPHESENNQLTLYLYQVEEDTQGVQSGYYQVGQNTERLRPTRYNLRFLVTAHSKAPVQLREADQYRMVGGRPPGAQGPPGDRRPVSERLPGGAERHDPGGAGENATGPAAEDLEQHLHRL